MLLYKPGLGWQTHQLQRKELPPPLKCNKIKIVNTMSSIFLLLTNLKDDYLQSASSMMTRGLLPPSSRVTRFRLQAPAACWISLPTSTEPVKEILATSGWCVREVPAPGPKPLTMLTTPGGKPASLKRAPSANAVRGVCSAGFITTVHPGTNNTLKRHEKKITIWALK